MTTLTRPSPAKLNLTLRVTGLRRDGFHDIESLVTQVDLCDTVSVTGREDGRLSLDCDDPAVPADESNLALRAARALAQVTGVRRGVHISLAKRIPAGAGLGGGSSNAATTLGLLNELWETERSRDELLKIAAGLGSDVPLFFHDPLTVVRGRGQQVEEVQTRITAWATLILPALHCSTPAVYAAWDRLTENPRRPPLSEVLASASSAARLMDLLFNDLEEPAFAVEPRLRRLAERLGEAGQGPVRLTGSGSAMFRLFDDRPAAAQWAAVIESQLGVRTAVARLLRAQQLGSDQG